MLNANVNDISLKRKYSEAIISSIMNCCHLLLNHLFSWQTKLKSEGRENSVSNVKENMSKPSLNYQAYSSTRCILFLPQFSHGYFEGIEQSGATCAYVLNVCEYQRSASCAFWPVGVSGFFRVFGFGFGLDTGIRYRISTLSPFFKISHTDDTLSSVKNNVQCAVRSCQNCLGGYCAISLGNCYHDGLRQAPSCWV